MLWSGRRSCCVVAAIHLKRTAGDLETMKDTQWEMVTENDKGIFHSAERRADKLVVQAEKGCSTGDDASGNGK